MNKLFTTLVVFWMNLPSFSQVNIIPQLSSLKTGDGQFIISEKTLLVQRDAALNKQAVFFLQNIRLGLYKIFLLK